MQQWFCSPKIFQSLHNLEDMEGWVYSCVEICRSCLCIHVQHVRKYWPWVFPRGCWPGAHGCMLRWCPPQPVVLSSLRSSQCKCTHIGSWKPSSDHKPDISAKTDLSDLANDYKLCTRNGFQSCHFQSHHRGKVAPHSQCWPALLRWKLSFII